MWDALSLQEIMKNHTDVGDGSGKEMESPIEIMRHIGKGRHMVLAPQKAGHMRVAIAVHRRWTDAVRATHCASMGRSISLDLLTKPGAVARIISGHIPSNINCAADEIELHIQDLATLIGGLRRHMIFLGIDANIHIGEGSAATSTSGTALGAAPRSQCRLRMAVTTEMQGHGMRLHNTFEDWWRMQAAASTAASTSTTSSPSRATWRGCLFGQPAQRPIDYAASDIVTSRRLIAAHFGPLVSSPRDHVALGCEYDLGLDLGLKRTRSLPKPIGWWPQHVQEYDAAVTTRIDDERPQTIGHLTEILAAAASRTTRTRRRERRPGRSETEDSLRAALHAGSATPDTRRAILDMMWTQRHRIAAEKTSSCASSILRDLRGGEDGELVT